MTSTSTVDTSRSFADCLNELFDTVRDENGIPYTGKKIALKANRLGYTLSDAYISQLRTGKAKTPSFRTVEAISRAFEISITYFLSDPDEDLKRVEQQREYVAMAAETGAHLAAFRHGELSGPTIDVVIELLKLVKRQAGSDTPTD
ncbi:helix-turn-helix domain-containing protein [Williamsia sp. CHRR-6]|uniref:helix-turn-helix domain-containing protein n=1 Tax=Williamsia sp. CHRR-6 TaxID=2835871 RepID=UPI001BDA0441|nr:helix-turn-helix domain-containing protein [Williamsia sp. CHRR-6]MBT0565959.1 helix-turn-helix transcriptional regulator [Williamsia sp. CHRR-6]